MAALLAAHKAEYARIQAAIKQAALQQHRSALRAADADRRELLSGADPSARQAALQSEAGVVATAEGITDGMRRTRQVLAEVSPPPWPPSLLPWSPVGRPTATAWPSLGLPPPSLGPPV